MNTRSKRKLAAAGPLVLAAMFCCISPSVHAAHTSGQFNVLSTLLTTNSSVMSKTGFCTQSPNPSSFGAVVTIVCATGAVADIQAPKTAIPWTPLHGGAYRFSRLAGDAAGVQFSGAIDSYIGSGTITSWRSVNLADRDYLEMLVGW
jgi:hypothetical protein